ncbi:MAG: MTAP family purine nucleoside phosphorylase [Clostridia bacterium]|nr:MTAP family purine nucleoside phosphorylase [Clostridia bacterium]
MQNHKEIEIMVMGGTEAYFLNRGDIGQIVEEVRLETPYGLANKISVLDLGGKYVGFMSRHGEHGYSVSAPFVNSRANIYAAKEMGAKRVLSWNGAGAISPHITPGDYVIIDDYIDMTKRRDYTYYVGKGMGFIRQNPAFCPECRKALFDAAKAVEPRTFDGGVYVCTEGPRLESKAEIRMYGMWGADVVGMTIIPELYLARELEMCYASLTYISNFAEGSARLSQQQNASIFSSMLPEEVAKRMKDSTKALPLIFKNAMLSLLEDRKCNCSHSMDVYKKRGDITEDWHTWVTPPEK